MNLPEIRQRLRHLLDERHPGDAIESYYAFHHPDNRTQIVLEPTASDHPRGFITLAQTGFDLFRPMVTWRLPLEDLEQSTAFIYQTMTPGMPIILLTPPTYLPLVHTWFTVEREEMTNLLSLDQSRYEPVINVLVTQAESGNEWPRMVIRSPNGTVAASAMVNWQSRYFAEIAVHTQPNYRGRGWGQSVVSTLCQYVLERGRIPLYAVNPHNAPSLNLAERVGFVDTGQQNVIIEAVLRPRP